MDYTLVLLLGIPLAGAIIGALLPSARAAKVWALVASLAALALVAWIVIPAGSLGGPGHFDYAHSAPAGENPLAGSFQMRFPLSAPSDGRGSDATSAWSVLSLGFGLSLGIDSISLWLVALTALLMPLAILSSWGSIKQREKEYYAWMLALMVAMLGVFLARDLLLFYIFFELTLVPMFFIIGIWGGPQRRFAAGKFFLFTFGGSIFTLAAVIYLGARFGTFDLAQVTQLAQSGSLLHGVLPLSSTERWWVALGLLAGLAVKVPLFPVHTWLPLAHTEAPTAGSVILAGVLLKLGTYGLLRLWMPIGMIDAAGVTFPGLLKFVAVLCIIGIVYGALVAWVQQDIKKLVAYSSVSHLGFCVLGLLAVNSIGMRGSVLYMVNHGLSTGALFLVVGMIYDRYHTRDINLLSGLARRMPRLAFFFVFFTLSSIGLPGLNGFISEFMCVVGAFTSSHLGIAYAVIASLGVILGAVYMLHLLARVVWGPLKEPTSQEVGHETSPGDIGGREITVLVPLALAAIFLGVMPQPVLNSMKGAIDLVRQPAPTATVPAGSAVGSDSVSAVNRLSSLSPESRVVSVVGTSGSTR